MYVQMACHVQAWDMAADMCLLVQWTSCEAFM